MNSLNGQEILTRISKHCPDAMHVYIQCLNRANEDGIIHFSRQLVEIDMSEGWTKFRNSIKKLAQENLLEWHPLDNGISVTLAAIDDE